MEGLTLTPGGLLIQTKWVYDDKVGKGEYVEFDITNKAFAYLFEPVRLAEGVTLRDVFLLLQANPLLFSIYCRDYAVELVAEGLTAYEGTPASEEPERERIEYLELYQSWYRQGENGAISGTQLLSFHGIGPVLSQDVYEHGHLMYAAGSRVSWGISLTSPAKLAALPLRFNPRVCVYQDDTEAPNYAEMLENFEASDCTLGQVFQGILWELSFHGAGDEREAFAQALRHTAAEAHAAAVGLNNG